jgi:hypothetical protein
MATIPELLDRHITLEVECLDRLYLNGYIGKLATGAGLMMFMRGQLGKPVPSPVALGQVSEKFREAVKALAQRECIPFYQFRTRSGRTTLPMPSGGSGRCQIQPDVLFSGQELLNVVQAQFLDCLIQVDGAIQRICHTSSRECSCAQMLFC